MLYKLDYLSIKTIYLFKGSSINDVGNRKGRGVKKWSKLPTNSTKKTTDMGEGGVKNPEKLPTSFMDGSYVDSRERTFNFGCYVNGLTIYRRSEFPWIKLAKR